MFNTIAPLMLVALSALAQTESKPIEFTLQPLTQRFSVLGRANGSMVVEHNTSCVIVAPAKFTRPQADAKSVHVSSVRFGIAVANGRNDWKPLATSKFWPLDVNVSSAQETTVEYAFGCFEMPTNLVEGQYWLFMQINFDDAEHHSSSTYAATKEYWKLINVPKDVPVAP